MLPADSVFEDLDARVVDLDGDGRDEIIVVRSCQDSGAPLLILGVRDGFWNPSMCRSLISVDWQGYVYDCDFNSSCGGAPNKSKDLRFRNAACMRRFAPITETAMRSSKQVYRARDASAMEARHA